MLWAPLIGGALTLAGTYLGREERPTIDPEMLKMLFGPGAISGDTQEFYRNLLNSPAFAELMRSANVHGTQLGNSITRNVAAAGVGGNPVAAFAKAAGRGYGGALQLPMMSDLFMRAFAGALQNNQARMGVWAQSQLGRQDQPTFGRMLGTALLGTGSSALDQWLKKLGTGGGGGGGGTESGPTYA